MSTGFQLPTAFLEYRCLIKWVHLFLVLQNPTILECGTFSWKCFWTEVELKIDLNTSHILEPQLVDWEGHSVGETRCVSSGCSHKVPQTGWRKRLFLIVLETGKSKMKLPDNWFPGESSHPCLQMGAFLWYPHVMERNSSSLNSSSYAATDLIMGLHPCDFNQT